MLAKLSGFRLVGDAPDVDRCVVIFAPHTSNWDFPLLMLLRWASGRRVSYLGKHTLFRWPFGGFFRLLGGIAVERESSRNRVSAIAALFAKRQYLWLAISPEGTRSKAERWRSGFYYIARAAEVPVLLVFIDSANGRCGIGELIWLTGDVERDLERIRDFYRDKRGIHPERESPIRF